LSLVALVMACGVQTTTGPAGGVPAVRDDLGRLVTLDEPPRRIASLAPGFTEILFAIGCGDRIAVRDRWSDHPREAASIPAIDGLAPAAQHVAGFSPDLVLLYAADGRHAAPLEKLGIPVAVFNPDRFEEVAETVARIGLLAGCAGSAAALADSMLAARDRVAASRDDGSPLVYIEIDGTDPARPWTAGPGSFVHELVALAGGRNAAAGIGGAYAQVNAESLIRTDPDFVLLLDVAVGDGAGASGAAARRFASRSGWGQAGAVRAGRVIDWIDRDLVSRPGPRLAEGLELLAEALSR
jgi:iron complex transport system substrate-binding protein